MNDELMEMKMNNKSVKPKTQPIPKVYNLKMSADQMANHVKAIVLVASGQTETFSLSWANITVNVQLLETPTTQVVQEN